MKMALVKTKLANKAGEPLLKVVVDFEGFPWVRDPVFRIVDIDSGETVHTYSTLCEAAKHEGIRI